MAKLNLEKGKSNKLSLKKVAPLLKELRVEFSWKSAGKLDLDASIFICRQNELGEPIIRESEQAAFYNQKITGDMSVKLGDDVRDGTGQLETADIYLDRVDPQDNEVALIMTIEDNSANKSKTFGLASEGTFTLFNKETDEAILEFNFVGDDTAPLNVIHVGSILREKDGSWSVVNYGLGRYTKDGIRAAFDMFGAPESWFEDSED